MEGALTSGSLSIDVGGRVVGLTSVGILRKRGTCWGKGSVRDRVMHPEGVEQTTFRGALPGEPSIAALPGPDGAGRNR